jgi:hypothetical protein
MSLRDQQLASHWRFDPTDLSEIDDVHERAASPSMRSPDYGKGKPCTHRACLPDEGAVDGRQSYLPSDDN